MHKKLLILLGLLLLVASFFYFDLHHLLSLDAIKANLADFQAFVTENPLLSAAIFFIIYVTVTAVSFPGAAVLTLLGGALFGFWKGLLLVSFASTLGAVIAFLAARYLFQDNVQSKFGDKLASLNDKVENEGGFYLFTLRLIPIFPFFLINLLMGLTPIKTFTFAWVSQLGMLPGTALYVNAGKQLSQLDSLSGILSPEIIISLILLGIFPLLAKKIINWFQAKKVYSGFNKPKQFDNNLLVIGAGAAGLVNAYIASAVKAKVTLVEASEMGGDCLNYGCVPSKSLINSAKLLHEIKKGNELGLIDSNAKPSFPAIMQQVLSSIKAIEPHDSVERYTDLGVEVIKGYATLTDPWTASIQLNSGEQKNITAKNIVIATGAAPFVPAIEGIESVDYLTSETLWQVFAQREQAPKRLVILGGGPIGCELSQAFARLGIEVTLLQRGDVLVPREDAEVSAYIKTQLEHSGVNVLIAHDVTAFGKEAEQSYLLAESNGDSIKIEFDDVILAVGRKARLEGFGLEQLGVETGRTLKTNDYLQTNIPNIYGAGDVVGPYQFTHVAAHHAWYSSVNALFGRFKTFKVDYSVIPWTTFTAPEISRVGLNETEAKAQGIDYEVTQFEMKELDRAIVERHTEGWIKVITPKGKDKILGVTIVSEHAGELLAEFVLAMRHGLGMNKILGTIHAYPTWNEAVKYSAGEWKRNNKPEWAMKWLERFHAWNRR